MFDYNLRGLIEMMRYRSIRAFNVFVLSLQLHSDHHGHARNQKRKPVREFGDRADLVVEQRKYFNTELA